MIALSSAARSAGDGSPPSSTATTVWRNRARRVRVSGLARPAAGRSNGFRCTPGAPRWMYAPPTAAASRAYSSSGSITQHSVPWYRLPEDLQLGQVGLARAGGGEGDGVVVVGRPPVPGHQPRPGGVGPVQDAGQRARGGRVAGQVGGGEREAGGERGGVHGAAQQQLVGPGGQGRGPALQRAEGGRDGDQQQGRGQCPHRLGLGGQVLLRAGVDGQVQAEPEQLALAPGQPVGQVAGVVGGGLGVGVIELPAVGAGAAAGFQPGALAAQPGGGDRDRDRLDVQGDIQPPG